MTEASPPTTCRNCSAALTGPFCAQCGQAAKNTRAPVIEASSIIAQQTLGADGRIWRTLFNILFKPGRLTVEFLEGKQRRALHPLRLFLIASVIAFFTPDIVLQEPWERPAAWDDAVYADASFAERFGAGAERLSAMRNARSVKSEPTQQEYSFGVYHNQIFLIWIVLGGLFSLVPVLKILRPKRLLYDHLIFVLHIGSFAYLSDLLFRLLQIRSMFMGIPQQLIQSLYVIIAFRVVYAWRSKIGLPVDVILGLALFVALTAFTQILAHVSRVWLAMPH